MTVTNEEILTEIKELRAIITISMDGPMASEYACSGKYGDPIVRFDPKTWSKSKGSFKGKTMSQCPVEFLLQLAAALTNMGEKAEREKAMYNGKAQWVYNYDDAARARRWALKVMLGYKPKAISAAKDPTAPKEEKKSNPFGKKETPAPEPELPSEEEEDFPPSEAQFPEEEEEPPF